MKNSYLCKCSMFGLLCLVFLAVAVRAMVIPENIQGQDDLSQARISTFNRPDPEGVPTKVYVGMFIFDLISIDDVSQSFVADFWGILRWKDPRLAISNPSGTQKLRNFGFEEIWHPMAIIINQRNLSKYNDDLFLDTRSDRFPDFVKDRFDGRFLIIRRDQDRECCLFHPVHRITARIKIFRARLSSYSSLISTTLFLYAQSI